MRQLRPDGPHELRDLAADAGEKVNLYAQPRQTELQGELESQLREFFDHHADPQYDLRRRGSKTRLLSEPRREPVVPRKIFAKDQYPR